MHEAWKAFPVRDGVDLARQMEIEAQWQQMEHHEMLLSRQSALNSYASLLAQQNPNQGWMPFPYGSPFPFAAADPLANVMGVMGCGPGGGGARDGDAVAFERSEPDYSIRMCRNCGMSRRTYLKGANLSPEVCGQCEDS